MRVFHLNSPLSAAALSELRVGDRVFLSGSVLTARDAAHKKLVEEVAEGMMRPELNGCTIYYCGPCPGDPDGPIISAGPTTSGRMDAYTPAMLSFGVRALIGKGPRSPEVYEALRMHGAVYFAATGGAGALLAKSILSHRVLAYPELGPEAVLELRIHEMPLIVATDLAGGVIYPL